MKLPLLLGIDNPHSADPRAALLPRPRGSAGHRLWKLSGMPWSEYSRKFDRANACDCVVNVRRIVSRTVVVLGRQAWEAISLKKGAPFFSRMKVGELGSTFILIPHPSGRSRFYNLPENRQKVTKLLRDIGADT